MLAGDSSVSRDREFVRMIMTTPSLRGEFFKTVVARENALAEAIADRLGSPATDLFPRLLAATYCGATRVVIHRWLDDPHADYRAILREALDMIGPMAAAHQAARRAA
jgi:hypothetical protein